MVNCKVTEEELKQWVKENKFGKRKFFIKEREVTEEEYFNEMRPVTRHSSIKCAIDSHIDKYGAVVDNMGGQHTTAQSYKNYLKDNGLVIKDWTPGTLKKS